MGDIVDTLAALGVPEIVAHPLANRFLFRRSHDGRLLQRPGPRTYRIPGSHRSPAVLIRDVRYRHPYYWAAYYASGSGNSNLSHIFQAVR